MSVSSFFSSTTKPADLSEVIAAVKLFLERNSSSNVVLITSGGTAVPLEKRAVRFINNFSQGTRGAASCEHFLRSGFAAIMLHTRGSRLPFERNLLPENSASLLDLLQVGPDGRVQVQEKQEHRVKRLLEEFNDHKSRLLSLPFITLMEYLWYLRAICEELKRFEKSSMVYLAAAVSDFYLPDSLLPDHKIQSNQDKGLNLELCAVPKMLKCLVDEWVDKHVFVISFKLETDPKLLESKAKAALKKYGHQLVIANLLQDRKQRVVFVSNQETVTIEKGRDRSEIEEKIVKAVIERFELFERQMNKQ